MIRSVARAAILALLIPASVVATPLPPASAAIVPADYSILEAQIGYKPYETKQAFIVADNPTSESLGPFQLKNASTGATVHTGNVTYWGQRWGQAWWTMDFSGYRTTGSYYVDVPSLSEQSSTFSITESLFVSQTLLKTSIDQLEPRIKGKLGWQDCGHTDWRGVEGHATLLYGLIDAFESYEGTLSTTDRSRFLDSMEHGADYLLALQKPNGSFGSEYYDFPNLITWHKSLLATIALLQVYEVTGASAYLNGANAGWTWIMSRPEFTRWETGAEVNDTRQIFGQKSPFLPPTELRTRDKLTLVWGATEFYKVTGTVGYKTIALDYANQVYDNQFLDYTQAVEGAYGNFHAWSGTDIFQKSWEHGQWYYNNGAVLPDHILGLVQLIEMFPSDPAALKWRYVLKVYKDKFLKTTTALNPFKLYPVGMYDQEIRYFGPTWHGTNGMYGNIAKNAMLLARLFDDPQLQQIADANMEWVAGLNAGVTQAGKRQSISMIEGIGAHSVETPIHLDGAISNGLASTPQFSLADPDSLMDRPATYTDEDWIVHSGGWLSGLSEVEKTPVIRVVTKDNGVPVSASVSVALSSTTTYTTDASGLATITTLPRGETGTISATYGGITITRPLVSIAGDDRTVAFDFRGTLTTTLTTDPSTGSGTVTAQNHGTSSTAVSGSIDAIGATLSTTTFSGSVGAGGTANYAFTFTDNDAQKIQPYLIRATASTVHSAASAEQLGEFPVATTPRTSFANHDFESGDLSGWTVVSGTAFSAASVVSLNTAVGGNGDVFNKQGDYAVWGWKAAGDAAVGELRSPTFTAGTGNARLKIGGGQDPTNLYVALVDSSSGTVLEKATGTESESMRWVVWNMDKYAGRSVYVRVLDNSTTAWGHVNVDDINVPVYSDGFSTDLQRFGSVGASATWTVGASGLTGTSTDAAYMSGRTGSNFTYEADINLTSAQAGALVFRSAANPYTGGGYFVNLDKTEGKVKLFKVAPYSLIAATAKTINANTVYHLRVVTKNQNIKVYFNHETTPSIDINDSTYSSGRFGVAVYNGATSAAARFNHVAESPASGFESNLGALSPVGDFDSWTEEPGGLTGSATGGSGYQWDSANVSTSTGTNFTYQGDIRLDTAEAAALVFRSAANPYTGGGYFVNIDRTSSQVKLFKLTPYHLRVVTSGTNISVYFNHETSPAITATDSSFTSGRFGVQVYHGVATFNNLAK